MKWDVLSILDLTGTFVFAISGAVPPSAINDWRYIVASLIAGVATFLWYPGITRLQQVVLLFDAAGLGLFAVSGTQKALAYGIHPFVAALLGMLTGIGGGVLRDGHLPIADHARAEKADA